jgi:hypothetical protein
MSNTVEFEIIRLLKTALSNITAIKYVTDELTVWQGIPENKLPAVYVSVDSIERQPMSFGVLKNLIKAVLLIAIGGKDSTVLNSNYNTVIPKIVEVINDLHKTVLSVESASVENVQRVIDSQSRYALVEMRVTISYNSSTI